MPRGRSVRERISRIPRGLRAVPRALREDLLTVSAEPLPPAGRRPGWLEWTPALAVPVVLLALFLGFAAADDYEAVYRLGPVTALLFAGAQAGALVGALYRPVPAWWVSTVAPVLAAVLSGPVSADMMERGLADGPPMPPWTEPGFFAHAGVLFLLALRTRPRVAAEALVVSLLVGTAGAFLAPDRFPVPRLYVVAFTVPVVLGVALRGRRVARTRLAEQEERTAEERARRTLLEERNRIARELHDVVAHHMSVISIQAQVAPHLVADPSPELRENLAGIRGNAVEALTELRRVLGVLRSEDPGAEETRAPQPGLDRLDELLGTVRGAGVEVTAETTGEPRPLSPGVELSAFRIVQEALSNAMRHAPGAVVRVEIGHRPDALTVRVANTAPGREGRTVPSVPSGGQGLLGMRERAAMLGGELAAGPTPGGGWEVTAVLPADTADPADSAEDPV
ncbi:sensor histidine kinase [Streptomyces sp. TRM 70361]|uniref:sensor histidine kinase n=1 Tax=Streptomyces sp. TRM 70361 TaxID=3116553 RepID=UPI002E7B2691|nr:sensor histidine kinase [Streptomyces sp. TRM 70361]MEE1941366.1 sensor histidine kinase [Streptomyces sp. TRM 70361]